MSDTLWKNYLGVKMDGVKWESLVNYWEKHGATDVKLDLNTTYVKHLIIIGVKPSIFTDLTTALNLVSMVEILKATFGGDDVAGVYCAESAHGWLHLEIRHKNAN